MGKTILLREVKSDFGDSPPLECGSLRSSDLPRRRAPFLAIPRSGIRAFLGPKLQPR